MRINREEGIWIDEFTLEEQSAFNGTLSLTDEKDDSDLIYLRIGTEQIGFIVKEELVKVAEKIIELWKEKEGSVEAKPQ